MVGSVPIAAGFAPALGGVEIGLAAALLPLLVLSGFFSSSETALFGMTESERIGLRRRRPIAGGAADRLLAEPRMLLVTMLLGNTTINTLYFVTSSVLLVRLQGHLVLQASVAMGTLLGLVVLGEIVPKLAGETRREVVASLVAPPLLALHRVVAPLRIAIARGIVAPLTRLTAPQSTPPRLSADELAALLEISTRQGVIEGHEQELLLDVMRLQRLRVRDVQVPRVRMVSIPVDADEDLVRRTVAEARLSRIPVHEGDLDHIVGLLPVKRYLLADKRPSVRSCLERVSFVPEIASVEALLVGFRDGGGTLAITVDEYGGTSGVVALEDVVEAIVGEIAAPEEELPPPPRRIDALTWEVSGEMGVHDWQDTFGESIGARSAVTLGGLMMERLGRPVAEGDRVRIGNVELRADRVERALVRTVTVHLLAGADGNGGASGSSAGGGAS
ncbi:MAG: hemolysin family protein [Phycisphaerales bacterium]|jgi:putative hemolysin